MILKKIAIFFMTLGPLMSIANSSTIDINTLAEQSYQRAAQMMPNVLASLHQPIPTKKTEMASADIFVFVSLGMPDLLLQQILKEAKQWQAHVVIRGLYRDSFAATFQRLSSLVGKEPAEQQAFSGVMINPLWFREYQIVTVPAVVMPRHVGYDVVFGNLTVSEAVEKIKRYRHTKGIA